LPAADRLSKVVADGARTLVQRAKQVVARAIPKPPPSIPADVVRLSPTALGLARAQKSQVGPYTIATFNVENFFPEGVGHLGDRARPLKTPESLGALAEAFKQLDADVVGIQEIYDAATMKRFVEIHLKDLGYQFLSVTRGNDSRGINVGILSRLPVRRVQSHTNLPVQVPGNAQPERLSRDLLQATIAAPGGDIEVFVVHQKSLRIPSGHEIAKKARRRGVPFEVVKAEEQAETLAKQEGEAWAVRDFIRGYQRDNPGAKIALVGDGNNVPDSKPIRILLGHLDDDPKLHHVLLEDLGPGAVTHESPHGHMSEIDQLDLSPALRELTVPGSVEILRSEAARVSSDHFPAKVAIDPARKRIGEILAGAPVVAGAQEKTPALVLASNSVLATAPVRAGVAALSGY
jgi:endonuclease/exonuclease/phosphatase family metal-dependent hydrolase